MTTIHAHLLGDMALVSRHELERLVELARQTEEIDLDIQESVTRQEWEVSRRERIRRETEEMHTGVDALFERWGIPEDLEAIPAEQLQQMMVEGGINPEDNVLSRAVVEMREE